MPIRHRVLSTAAALLTLLSATPASVATPAPKSGFTWPLQPRPPVTRRFEPPPHPYGPGHRGADLAGSVDQQVLAAGEGIVVFAAPVAGRPVLSIDHPGGLRTTYEPVAPLLSAGQQVSRGQPIGLLQPGHQPCPAAACLHWGVRRDADYLDPLRLVDPGHIRLKPWENP
ncbi:M23 family metallopeptidase [Pseudonocardiaceae bacterium YIM PH 21723]|nr:M23 family metallopeptidase [Pseudonocardiaceae bacterium YIM PH 21723]